MNTDRHRWGKGFDAKPMIGAIANLARISVEPNGVGKIRYLNVVCNSIAKAFSRVEDMGNCIVPA